MCKRVCRHSPKLLFCFLVVCFSVRGQNAPSAQTAPAKPQKSRDSAPVQPSVEDFSSDAASKAALEKAQENLAHIQALVAAGQKSQHDLEEAQTQLADAQDEETLARTLYSGRSAQDMTPEEAQSMLAAARSRVDRQTKRVAAEKVLRRKGLLTRSQLADSEAELQARERVLGLVEQRVWQIEQLTAMASQESGDPTAAPDSDTTSPIIRYDGTALFNLRELRGLERSYQNQFHERLPVSAIGQTRLHSSLGLNHRGRVDVALNPDCPEGLWLRQYLEDRHIPYLAFRCAIRGAATAPHIHIGPESSRLRVIRRSGSLKRVRALR